MKKQFSNTFVILIGLALILQGCAIKPQRLDRTDIGGQPRLDPAELRAACEYDDMFHR